jgi:protein TonB
VTGTEDAATLAQYRLAIIAAAKRYKRYPRVAMDNNWEGKVEVRMVIGANGMISVLSVRTSAGHEILDQQALDMIKKAKPLTPIPSALRGKEFTVDIPVIFSLKDSGA